MSYPTLTPFKRRALEEPLAQTDRDIAAGRVNSVGHTGRSLAAALWPDSPAWNKRTRGSGASKSGGNAMGGTMPMKGARVGWELRDAGLAQVTFTSVTQPMFTITTPGRELLRELTKAESA